MFRPGDKEGVGGVRYGDKVREGGEGCQVVCTGRQTLKHTPKKRMRSTAGGKGRGWMAEVGGRQ